MRYLRHYLLPEIGIEGQQRLQQASVLIVGVGGLGSPVSLYLAAAGVGRLGLMDADTVSESNLQRQVLYQESEIGKKKVECARNRLLQLNSSTQIDIYDERLDDSNAERLIADYDLVVDCSDNYATRYLIDRTTHKQGRPFVYGSIGEFSGQVSVFNYLGGISYLDLFPDQELLSTQPPAQGGVMGVVPGVVGCLQASEVIKIITQSGTVLRNRLWSINLLTLETKVIEIE